VLQIYKTIYFESCERGQKNAKLTYIGHDRSCGCLQIKAAISEELSLGK
jgi:hypothetical protein